MNFGVIGFSDEPQVHKKIEEKFDEFSRDKIYTSIDSSPSGGTNDSDAIKVALDMISRTGLDRVKVIIVISDGEGKEDEVRKLVEEAEEAGIKIIGVGIGEGMRHIGEVYKYFAYVEDMSALPAELSRILRNEIEEAIIEEKKKISRMRR